MSTVAQEQEDFDEFGLTEDDEEWCQEPEVFEDFISFERARPRMKIPSILPSQFTEFAFKMPRADGLGYDNFSFDGRTHLRRVYDTPTKRILLFCGRQVEKSTLLGNKTLCYSCMIPAYKTLYVSPSATQTKTFSGDRIKEPIETSDVLKSFTTTMLSQNIFEKQFVNRSKVTLRYAFLNADRTRGIPAHALMLDELQDILGENIPIIEQCTSHAPDELKRFIYAGTPKSLDNIIEFYRSGYARGRPMSTMGEWVVPCDAHGGETGRYWNILGEKNIQKKGLSCEKCQALINPMHEDAQWAMLVKDGIFESYRIPQLMVPWKPWPEILLDYGRYPRDKFYNEVLGISYDSGLRPLTLAQLRDECLSKLSMHPSVLAHYAQKSKDHDVYCGIDWGTGENTYTVLTLAVYEEMKFRVFYVHRFIGEETDPPIQLAKIEELIKRFHVRVIGTDYGGGFDRNDHLVRKFGNRLQKYQYMARCKKKVEYDGKLRRFKVHRTEVMSDIFNAIKRHQFEFPRWEEFFDPYGQDMLNIFSEYNETLKMIQYSHRPDKPDDTFHSVLYCFLASMIVRPRPDIIVPIREEPNRGPQWGGYSGPINQG